MKKSLQYLLALFMASAVSVQAQTQRNCATMEYLEQQKSADPSLEGRMQDMERSLQQWISDHPNYSPEAPIVIPVVFHVVYNTSAQNISDARILAQLDVLNKDYSRTNADAGNTPSVWQSIAANTNVQFCMAQRDPSGNATSGIVRKSTTVTSFSTNDNIKRNANGGDDAWPASSYLNIWVGNLSGGVLGYAQFPGGSASTDGVVLLYSSVGGPSAPGTASPYHLGRTATHEVGHWLNLYHIWGDDGTACTGSDQVSDTPNQADENYGCPAFPTVSCSNGPNGDMFMNYMDYTDDACMNLFTAGQSTRMTATLNGTRLSLQSSLGCTPPSGGGTCAVPSGLNATSITQTSATLNWSAASGAVSYNVQYRVNGSSNWTSTTSTTTSKAISGLTAGTTYEFQVQTVCSSSSSAFSGSATFSTTAASCSDVYEANNSISAAKTISAGTIVGLISPSGDNDYFKITTTSPNTYMRITLSNLPADYDLRLYNSSGTQLAISQNGGTTNEVITRNTSTAATYYIRVYGYSGANNASQCYNLAVAVQSSAFRTMNGADVSDDQSMLQLYPNPASSNAKVIFNNSVEGVVSIRITDMVGKIAALQNQHAAKGFMETNIDLSSLNNGIYFVEVSNGTDRETRKLIISK